MCLRAKFRGSPKALITKDKKLLIRPIQGGIVTSLKIIVIGMGDRGSKSIIGGINLSCVLEAGSHGIVVKEQRVDGSSVINIYDYNCKVYSGHRETGSRQK